MIKLIQNMPARIMVNNTKIIVTLSSTLNPTNTAYIPFSITIQTDEFTYQQGDIVKFLGKVNGSEIVESLFRTATGARTTESVKIL